MSDSPYTKLFEQIYKRAEERFFEEVYNSNNSKEYDSLFESIYQKHLIECTAHNLYQLIIQYKKELSNPKTKSGTINRIVNTIIDYGNEIFEITKKDGISAKPKPCIFLDELDQIYWKDSKASFTQEFLIDTLYNIFIGLKNHGVGIGEPTLKNAVVGKTKKNFWDANNGNYEKALKHFISDFIENNSRADFSNIDNNVRTEYADKFKKEFEHD
jgi:hypothetical protein